MGGDTGPTGAHSKEPTSKQERCPTKGGPRTVLSCLLPPLSAGGSRPERRHPGPDPLPNPAILPTKGLGGFCLFLIASFAEFLGSQNPVSRQWCLLTKIIRFIHGGGEVHSSFSCLWGTAYSWCVTEGELFPRPHGWDCWCPWGGRGKQWRGLVNTRSHPCMDDLPVFRPARGRALRLPLFGDCVSSQRGWETGLRPQSCSTSPRPPPVFKTGGLSSAQGGGLGLAARKPGVTQFMLIELLLRAREWVRPGAMVGKRTYFFPSGASSLVLVVTGELQ